MEVQYWNDHDSMTTIVMNQWPCLVINHARQQIDMASYRCRSCMGLLYCIVLLQSSIQLFLNFWSCVKTFYRKQAATIWKRGIDWNMQCGLILFTRSHTYICANVYSIWLEPSSNCRTSLMSALKVFCSFVWSSLRYIHVKCITSESHKS